MMQITIGRLRDFDRFATSTGEFFNSPYEADPGAWRGESGAIPIQDLVVYEMAKEWPILNALSLLRFISRRESHSLRLPSLTSNEDVEKLQAII